MRLLLIPVLTAWMSLACLAGPAEAALRALLVGIDDYASVQKLRGAASDARDIARSLALSGVEDVTVMVDRSATRQAFERSWSELVSRSQQGDVLLLSFSGHGVRTADDAGLGRDGISKGFLLQPYAAASAPDEILRDEHLYDLFAKATDRGVRILFVADACHAGAAVRSVDPRGSNAPFRFQRFNTTAPPLSADAVLAQAEARPPNPKVTVFSATDERLTIQEVLIDDQYRGALSYAFARGLLTARSEGSGIVTAGSLERFVRPLIRVLSGNRQIPQFAVPDDTLPLVRPGGGTAEDSWIMPELRIAVLGEPVATKLEGASTTNDFSRAELVWDRERRQLVDANGDVLGSSVGDGDIEGYINARRVLDAMRRRLAAQSVPVRTVIGKRATMEGAFFVEGMKVEFGLDPAEFGYATMINMNASGVVQLMWPLAALGDPAGGAVSAPLRFKAPVTAPFGADYVISLLSREPLLQLQQELRRLHGTVAPLEFLSAFRDAAARTEIRIGIEGVYSCKTLGSDGRCDAMLTPSR
jgi:hypothetical protein